jgi:hypothetical protein
LTTKEIFSSTSVRLENNRDTSVGFRSTLLVFPFNHQGEGCLAKGPPISATGGSSLIQAGKLSQRGLAIERISFDRTQIRDKELRQCKLDGISFRDAELADCAFFHTRFTDCYFKNTSFKRVRFIDCFFEHCDFDGAVFLECGLEYSEFRLSRIAYRQIEECLPTGWQNVLFRLARSLRMNAQSMGDYDEYRRFLSLELEASERHFLYMFTKYDGYYQKYRFVDRLRALKSWIVMLLDRWLWGHGESWTRVLFFAIAVVMVFAVIFRYSSAASGGMPDGSNFWTCLAFSVSNFLTMSFQNGGTKNALTQSLVLAEAALGLLSFGLLVTSLYARISKR